MAYERSEKVSMLTETETPVIEPLPNYLDAENPLDGFDWQEVRQHLDEIKGELAEKAVFLVMFTSTQREDLSEDDKILMTDLDKASHEEADKSEALVYYFADVPDALGRAVSWCLWTDRQAAADALHGDSHKQAIQLAKDGKFYERYNVHFYAVKPDEEQGYAFKKIEMGHDFETVKEELGQAVA